MLNKQEIKRLYVKNYELLSYVFFGALTTAVNYISYIIVVKVFGINYIYGNIIAWIIAVSFAFITNKFYVFRSKNKNFNVIVSEFFKFTSARLATGVMETVLLWLFVSCLGCNDLIMKIITNILVIIGNYLFNKYLVFKKRKGK